MSKPQASVVLTFSVPIDSTTNTKAVQKAYADLRKQVCDLAESLVANPNVIISHTQIIGATLKPNIDPAQATVDTKIASLQSISKRIANGDSSVSNPKYKSKYSVDQPDDDDPARVIAVDVEAYRAEKGITAGVRSGSSSDFGPPIDNVTVTESTVPVDTEEEDKLKKVIFGEMIRRTGKSMLIMDYLVSNRGKPVSVSQIAEATNLKNGDVSIWLATTGQNVTGISDAGKRGMYVFDHTKVKI